MTSPETVAYWIRYKPRGIMRVLGNIGNEALCVILPTHAEITVDLSLLPLCGWHEIRLPLELGPVFAERWLADEEERRR